MFSSFRELVDLSLKTGQPLAEVVKEWEMLENGTDPEYLSEQSLKFVTQMIKTYKDKLNSDSLSLTGWTGFNTGLYNDYRNSNKSIFSSLISKSILAALATSESNACMGKIVACPTAGSSGVVPGVVVALHEEKGIDLKTLSESLIVAGAIGEFIRRKASLSGAIAGCQAEIGSACAMASTLVVYALKGSPQMVENAASLSLKFLMGLVCDPVGGFVEVPCVKRNPAASVLAFTAAEMSMSGIKSLIPFDEITEAMGKVGRSLSEDLRETGKGGIAATKTARSLLNTFFNNKV